MKVPARLVRVSLAGGVLLPSVAIPALHPPVAVAGSKQQYQCLTTALSTPLLLSAPSAGARILDFRRAWLYGRGAGQKVALIDTGVAPHRRLPKVADGGDRVSTSTGRDDCDAHGTIAAGIIAGRPNPSDSFSGVAPDAELIAIRQSSRAFKPVQGFTQPGVPTIDGYGNSLTLAESIDDAVRLGATVISVSFPGCGSLPKSTDRRLENSVRNAFNKNVVVVVAAGDLESSNTCKTQNALSVSAQNGWRTAVTAVTPAWHSNFVLTVGAVDAKGAPAAFSVQGPWVDVAAPGTDIVSVNVRGAGLSDHVVGQGKHAGTAYAAAYVSGVVALVREHNPTMRPADIIAQISGTAHHRGGTAGRDDAVGFGVIDPLAAVTGKVGPAPNGASVAIPAPSPQLPRDQSLAVNAGIAAGIIAAFTAVVAVLTSGLSRWQSRRDSD